MTTTYPELRALIGHYGQKLADGVGVMSHADTIAALDRLATLRAELKKSWDNR